MKNAELKVIRFGGNDVIATSGFTLSGVDDGVDYNISFNGTHDNNTRFVLNSSDIGSNNERVWGHLWETDNSLYVESVLGENGMENYCYNGIYTWDSDNQVYVRQQQ